MENSEKVMSQRTWTFSGGRLPPGILREVSEALRGLGGKRVQITLREAKKPRSSAQNRFYHGPFIESYRDFLLSHGYRLSHDEVHEGLREKHAKNGYTIFMEDGTPFRVPPSTARMSTTEIEDYMEEIRADVARFGWALPFPHEEF